MASELDTEGCVSENVGPLKNRLQDPIYASLLYI